MHSRARIPPFLDRSVRRLPHVIGVWMNSPETQAVSQSKPCKCISTKLSTDARTKTLLTSSANPPKHNETWKSALASVRVAIVPFLLVLLNLRRCLPYCSRVFVIERRDLMAITAKERLVAIPRCSISQVNRCCQTPVNVGCGGSQGR